MRSLKQPPPASQQGPEAATAPRPQATFKRAKLLQRQEAARVALCGLCTRGRQRTGSASGPSPSPHLSPSSPHPEPGSLLFLSYLILSGPNRKSEPPIPFSGSTFKPPSEGRCGAAFYSPACLFSETMMETLRGPHTTNLEEPSSDHHRSLQPIRPA